MGVYIEQAEQLEVLKMLSSVWAAYCIFIPQKLLVVFSHAMDLVATVRCLGDNVSKVLAEVTHLSNRTGE